MAQDISGQLNGFGVSLEKGALDAFGAAVDTGGNLPGRFIPPNNQDTKNGSLQIPGEWNSTPYASALVSPGSIDFNPKLKFMFKVSFKFADGIADLAQQLGLGYDLNKLQVNTSFLVRHIDRPKFDFEYDEVNMYNFRTHVLKAIKHREVSFTVYDDVGNNALSFVNLYRKLLQPIARNEYSPSLKHEDYGFAFNSQNDTSFRASLGSRVKNVLSGMTIHQIFVERGSQANDPSSWVKVVNFKFLNPRFSSIDIDDLDHEAGGNFNTVTFIANFDTVFMEEAQSLTPDRDGPQFNLGDITQSRTDSGPSGTTTGNQSTTFVLDTLGLSQGGASSVTDTTTFGGPLQEAGKRTIASMLANKSQAFARPSSPTVIDNSADPTTVADNTSSDTSQFT